MIWNVLRLLVLLIFIASLAHAAEEIDEDDLFIGGMTSVGEDLKQATHIDKYRSTALDDFRAHLDEQFGLTLSADYAMLYQKADSSLTEKKDALSGVFRIYGKWTAIGRGTNETGSVIAKIENRSRAWTDLAPSSLASQLGYFGITGTAFSDVGWFLAPLYWEQFLADGHVGVVAGRIDPLDFVDLLGIGSQWTSFQNASMLSNLSMPLPDVGFGAGVGVKLSDQVVLGATIHDANGSQTEVDFLVDGSEFFKQAYVSWTPTRVKRFTNALHLTFWHQDEREALKLEESYGVAVSGNWLINERWMPFVRWGLSCGDAPLAKQQLTAGVLCNLPWRSDQLGIGGWWQNLSHRDLDNQGGMEVFYRFQVIPFVAITPSVQLLFDPALNPKEDLITLYGLRARVVLF